MILFIRLFLVADCRERQLLQSVLVLTALLLQNDFIRTEKPAADGIVGRGLSAEESERGEIPSVIDAVQTSPDGHLSWLENTMYLRL